ncbi:hypothetical protein GSB46_005042 [Salmonella enterica]|nr:hypothetical protein [Salmonella enterica]
MKSIYIGECINVGEAKAFLAALNTGHSGCLVTPPFVPGSTFSYGIGGGNYRDGNALAAGVQFRTSRNTNVRVNVSWDSAGNSAAGVGFAGGW